MMAPSIHHRLAAAFLLLGFYASQSFSDNGGDHLGVFASAAPTPPVVPSITITDPDNNEACRLKVLNTWLEEIETAGSPEVAAFLEPPTTDTTEPPRRPAFGIEDETDLLEAMAGVQETPLYRAILEDCSYFVEAFHEAAETTCELEYEYFDNPYSRFWDIGPINLDGGLLLAADLLRSNMFENPRPLVPCADSCYVRFSEEDCQEGASDDDPLWKNNLADLTMLFFGYPEDPKDIVRVFRDNPEQEKLCGLQWLETDAAYQRLRLCAAESRVGRATIAARSSPARGDASLSEESAQFLQKASATARAFEVRVRSQADCLRALVDQNVCVMDENKNDAGGFGIENVGGPGPDGFYDDYYGVASDSGARAVAAFVSSVVAVVAAAVVFLL